MRSAERGSNLALANKTDGHRSRWSRSAAPTRWQQLRGIGMTTNVGSQRGRLIGDCTTRQARRARRALVAVLAAGAAVLALAPIASANGVPLANGDVLAATGNGQVENFSPSGTLLDTLDTTTNAIYMTGMCFLSNNDLLATDFGSDELSQFDTGGNLLAPTWASVPSTAESCTVDAANNVYVGGPSSPTIYKFNSSGTLVNSFSVTGGSRSEERRV